MSRQSVILAVTVLFAIAAGFVRGDDWIFDQAPYTNDAKTGERVEQFQKPKTPTRIPYEKFFSEDGPHPYIPYWYYEDEMGWPGYGLGGGFGGFGFGGIPSYGLTNPGAYMGPMAF